MKWGEKEKSFDVSLFSYFSQTVGLLEADPSLYCVSAWNDLGYQYTSADPALLYRQCVEPAHFYKDPYPKSGLCVIPS